MATYLLDTTICIYIAKHHSPEVLKRFECFKVGDIAMSLITYGELLYGAEKSRFSAKALENIQFLSEWIEVLPLTIETAFHYGEIRADLAKLGMPIGANDLPGLIVENWVDGD